MGAWLAACAGPALPAELPVASPASAQAAEAPPAQVTRALDEEPPLPGEPVDGWPGLHEPADDEREEPHHHAH